MIPISTIHPNNKRGTQLVLITLFLIFGCPPDKEITGTVDETDTGVIATLYNPNGTPAKGANVKIFEVSDTTKTPVSEVISDEDGHYSVKGLAKGTYYNVYAEKGSLVAFQDSISALEDTILIDADTLETPTSLSAFVGLQPNHDPRTVTVQVLGTDIYSNVNEDGSFTLNRMAKGDFTLKLSTTLENYTTTYENITIDAETPETLSDTLWLIYTGIPVVEGLTAFYDTLNGVITLSWNGTKYRDFQDFLIYRDYFDSLIISSKPISFTGDTVFYDSIFDKNISSGAFSFSDTNDYHFKYRVTIRNNSQKEGFSYKYVDIIAASTLKVKTDIEFNILNSDIDFDTTSDIKIEIILTNQTRGIVSVDWAMSHIDSIVRSTKISTPTQNFKDTLQLPFQIGISMPIYLICKEQSSAEWLDSIVLRAPEISHINDQTAKANVKFQYLPSVTSALNKSVKFTIDGLPEWCGFDSATGQLLGLPMNNDSGINRNISILATDGKLVARSNPFDITVLANPWKPFPPLQTRRWRHASVTLNGKIYVIGGQGNLGTLTSVEAYDTTNNTWESVSDFPVEMTSISAHVVNDKIYAFGGNSAYYGLANRVFEYDDTLDKWSEKSAMPTTRYVFNSAVLNNKIYIFGGRNSDWTVVNTIEVFDPETDQWQVKDKAGIFCGDGSCCSYNGKIYIIGGCYIKNSTCLKEYDPTTEEWITLSPLPLPLNITGTTAAVMNDAIFVFGGWDQTKEINSVYKYDITNNDWERKSDMVTGRSAHSSVVLSNQILVIGGNQIESNSIEQYFPDLDK